MSIKLDVRRYTETLFREGFCIIPNAMRKDRVAALSDDLAYDFEATPSAQNRYFLLEICICILQQVIARTINSSNL